MTPRMRSLSRLLLCSVALALAAPSAMAQESRWPWRRPAERTEPPPPREAAPSTSTADEVGRIRESTADPATDAESARFTAALSEAGSTHPALFIEGILVGPEGMTLYTYGRDSRGASTCYGVCERLWPPLIASIDDEPVGDFATFERLDGGLQWTYRGEPLYYWANDTRPGDVTGDNVNEVWFVIKQGDGNE
jgi:predicted lipoprotein with Yx(FWY)xxD motif